MLYVIETPREYIIEELAYVGVPVELLESLPIEDLRAFRAEFMNFGFHYGVNKNGEGKFSCDKKKRKIDIKKFLKYLEFYSEFKETDLENLKKEYGEANLTDFQNENKRRELKKASPTLFDAYAKLKKLDVVKYGKFAKLALKKHPNTDVPDFNALAESFNVFIEKQEKKFAYIEKEKERLLNSGR